MNNRKRWKSTQLQIVARSFIQLGRLLKKGYTLYAALTFIQLHVPKEMSEKIDEVLTSLVRGSPIHQAFSILSIPSSFQSIIYFYEQQGDIASGFIQAGYLLKKREKTKNKFITLLRYPLFLLWICFCILLLMYYFVLPHFQSFFSMTDELPLITKIVFTLIDYAPYIFFSLLLIISIFIIYFLYKYKKLSPYDKVMTLLSFPIVHKYVQLFVTYYFTLQLGRLLEVGLSLQQSLQVFQRQDYLPFFQQECVQIMHELHQGYSFSQLVGGRKYFRDEFVFVIENGEKTGYLSKDLVEYSELLFKEMEHLLQKGLQYVQPLFFIIVGTVIFTLFLATMIPLFQMVGIV